MDIDMLFLDIDILIGKTPVSLPDDVDVLVMDVDVDL